MTVDTWHQVVGGNFFSAKPVGVRGGVDYGFSGEVRRMDTAKISSCLARGEIVLLSCLGFSPSGEVFNVDSEAVAAACAIQVAASKLV
ncbi:unnamed protein product, partial [Discosporangium mesarthrocarpum]